MRAMLRALTAFAFTLLVAATAAAQEAPRVAIPNFWDPRIRLDRPEPGPPRVVRFLTDDDYPPFHFAGPDDYFALYPYYLPYGTGEWRRKPSAAMEKYFRLAARLGRRSHLALHTLAGTFQRV